MFAINLLLGPGTFFNKIAVLIGFVLVAIISIISHEVSHGYVALLNGDNTAKNRGRLTFNPSTHFEPVGTILIFLTGFGWAKPVPINPSNFKKYKSGMITVSLAGIITNCILAGIFLLLYFLMTPLFYKSNNSIFFSFLNIMLNTFITAGIRINIMLALFNSLPIYPLDGYNLVNTLLPKNTLYQSFMIKWGQVIIFTIVFLGIIGRYTSIPWLDLFGSFNNLITKLLDYVEIKSIIYHFGG